MVQITGLPLHGPLSTEDKPATSSDKILYLLHLPIPE